MSQGPTVLPTTGVFSGLTEQGSINAALAALLSLNSGGSAPSAPTQFQFWADTSVAGQIAVRQYIGTSWVPIWIADTATGLITLAASSPQNWAAASGTHDAIVAAYDPPVAALVDGMVLYFRAAAANQTAAPTFTPNSGVIAAHTIAKLGGQALWGADIPGASAECAVRYNLANTRWELISPTFDVPVGGMVPYFGGTVPNGFALPQGQNLSSAQFPVASAVLGTTYGNPGGGNFTMPDLRGRFFFNLDSGGSNRITVAGGNMDGTVLGNAGGAQNRTLAQANLPNVNFNVSGISLTNGAGTLNGNAATNTNGATNAFALGGVTLPAASLGGLVGNFSLQTNVSVATQGAAASGGSGTALATLPPAMGINCMMRIA